MGAGVTSGNRFRSWPEILAASGELNLEFPRTEHPSKLALDHSLDHAVGAHEEGGGDRQTKRPRPVEVGFLPNNA